MARTIRIVAMLLCDDCEDNQTYETIGEAREALKRHREAHRIDDAKRPLGGGKR